MRCRIGDLCIIVRTDKHPQVLGHWCRITGRAWNRDWAFALENPLDGFTHGSAMDRCLMPVRFRPGVDESLVSTPRHRPVHGGYPG